MAITRSVFCGHGHIDNMGHVFIYGGSMERLSLNKENYCTALKELPFDEKWTSHATNVVGRLIDKTIELEERVAQLEMNIKRLDRRMLGPGHESLSDV